MVRRDIIGSIAPWNYSLMMAAWILVPAITDRNTVVFKPSKQTPLTTMKIAKIFAKRTHFKLGCKTPVIACGDAYLDAVDENLKIFGHYNAGQDCTAACRIYAGSKIYDKLIEDLTFSVSTSKDGLENDADNEIGPLISHRPKDRVASFVEPASEQSHIEITTGSTVRQCCLHYEDHQE